MGNAAFIVFRESVEALLVVGILQGWLSVHAPAGLRWLWSGVIGGLILAGALAALLVSLPYWLPEQGLEGFQAGMPIVAASLIFQMVWWLRRHGAALKKGLERDAASAVGAANWAGVAVLAALAVGREGMETVVFLYGLIGNIPARDFLLAVGLGLLGACAVYFLLAGGSRWFSWRGFFRTTEWLLLLLGGALLVDGVEKLVGLGAVPALADPLWDSSRLLNDARFPGNWFAALAGYRAMPSGAAYLMLAAWWASVISIMLRLKPAQPS